MNVSEQHWLDRAALTTPLGVAVIAGLILVLTLITGGTANWGEEQGAIEWLSFLCLLAAPVVFVLGYPVRAWFRALPIPVFSLLLAMREGETDWWIVDERLLTPDFYVAEGPTLTAAAGLAIVIALVLATVVLVWRGIPAFFRGLWRRQGWAIVLFIGLASAVLGQVGEEIHSAGLLSPPFDSWIIVIEEALELTFAICVLDAVLRGGRLMRETYG